MVHLIAFEPSDRPVQIMVESRQEECLAIIGVFTVLSFLFLGFRLWSRYLGRNFGWDDYLIIFAGFCMLGQTITIWQWILLSGTGYHTWDIPKKPIHQQIVNNQWNFSIQMMYHPLMGSIRASIILFLFRMKDNRRRIRYSLHIVFWLNILYAVGTSLGNILQCNPVHYTWAKPAMDYVDADGKLVLGGSCINSRTFVLASCALSIFMDLIIIPIPSVMVWNLQMEVRTKFLVVIVMSLGWVATGVSVGRFIVYYYRFAPDNFDRTWNIGIAISIAEPAVHIMSACAPATKCLFRYLFPYFVRSRTPAYYQDRPTTSRTPQMSKFGSHGSRRTFGSFHFGLSNGDSRLETTAMEEIARPDPSLQRNPKEESEYDLRRLSSSNSQISMKDFSDGSKDGKRSLEIHDSTGTKTATNSLHEPVEAEPSHCLARAQ